MLSRLCTCGPRRRPRHQHEAQQRRALARVGVVPQQQCRAARVPLGPARRLLDASDQGGDTIPSCAAELPCVQKLLALQQNQTAFAAITNASNCPMQPADADKCFYVRALRCACPPLLALCLAP